MRKTIHAAWLAALLAAGALPVCGARVTLPLDGEWSIAESVGAEDVPTAFPHQVPVPGLVRSATPAFPGVDQYETHEFIYTMKRYGILPATEDCPALGRTTQKRNYFWYERRFRAPARKQRAILVINKAQFGTAVWLNGKKIGEHLGFFTAGRFDATAAIDWRGENRLIVRIGAHPGAVPEWALVGTDGEKGNWTPGIYDSVSLLLADNPVIENVQVGPRIAASEIVVETELVNYGPATSVALGQRVKTWKAGRTTGAAVSERVSLAAGEHKLVRQTVRIPDAVLWTPDNPFLYVLDTSSGGDTVATRFGMREFRFDGPAGRAILNGKVIYLRGASITLHRFFGDDKCGRLPWDENWVRKFLVEVPKRLYWNSFRICIGPAPQRWLDIADEAGLLLDWEFPIWDDREPLRHRQWKEEEVLAQIREFMRDNWNHPSVVLWDASNETHWAFLGDKVIPALRGLDLSNRPWENGYNPPQAPGDGCEVHPYLFSNHMFGKKPPFFDLADLEKMEGRKPQRPGYATFINEYDWLWLHRDGTPTHLTKKVYDNVLGPNASTEQRFSFYAYSLAGITEFWRAFRQYAGVLYLAYLDGDLPHAFTCDNFRSVEKVELEPHFEDYMREAFKPLGVYIRFWQPQLQAGTKRSFRVMMVNDTERTAAGKLALTLEPAAGGAVVARADTAFEVPALGQATYDVDLAVPPTQGRFLLKAAAANGDPWSPVISRRLLSVVAGSH